MPLSLILPLLFAPALAAPPAPPPPAPVKVMFVGVFHMAGAHDYHNMKVDDMLAPKRQAEIAAITSALARFKPTAVAVEWPAEKAAERYAQYRAGTLPASPNEITQLGFRLAVLANVKAVHGIDVDGDFPYEPVQAYAKAHGQSAMLDQMSARTEEQVQTMSKLLVDKGVSAVLRHLNDPASIKAGQDWYRSTLRIGGGNDQPAADLLASWYKRNFIICANLIQRAQPGDRIVVFYGAGHAHLLRQCATETPGFELVEANDFLPQ